MLHSALQTTQSPTCHWERQLPIKHPMPTCITAKSWGIVRENTLISGYSNPKTVRKWGYSLVDIMYEIGILVEVHRIPSDDVISIVSGSSEHPMATISGWTQFLAEVLLYCILVEVHHLMSFFSFMEWRILPLLVGYLDSMLLYAQLQSIPIIFHWAVQQSELTVCFVKRPFILT